jgi:hypothetical protein
MRNVNIDIDASSFLFLSIAIILSSLFFSISFGDAKKDPIAQQIKAIDNSYFTKEQRYDLIKILIDSEYSKEYVSELEKNN